MRINPDHGSQPLVESGRSNTAKTSVETSQSSGVDAAGQNSLGQDQAQLSGAGAQISALTAQALQLPDVRQERVQSLREAVQSGSYAPDPRTVAGAILDQFSLKPAA